MKTIVRRVPAHTIRSFQCEVCRAKYRTAKQALKCKARIKEKQVFKVGDFVKGYEPHVCSHKGRDRNFLTEGMVIKILGPMCPDYEYEVKWLGGKTERLNGHVYLYEVEYLCLCGKSRKYLYRAPEILFVK